MMTIENTDDGFIDMIETKQGWIQEEIANLYDLITNNDEIEMLDDPRIMLKFALKEIEKHLILRIKRDIKMYDDYV